MPNQQSYYQNVVPVSVERHRKLSVQHTQYQFAASINLAPLTALEMPIAFHDYTIVFANEGNLPVAILGFAPGQNLYLGQGGDWNADYIPAHIRRYPFVFSQDSKKSTITFAIDEGWGGCNFDGRGERLFDAAGNATPYLSGVLKFLEEYRAQVQRTEEFCRKLKDLDLLQPGEVQLRLPDGKKKILSGFMVISRPKLKSLSRDKLAQLVETNEIELIYTHLASMNHLSCLVKRISSNIPVPTSIAIDPVPITPKNRSPDLVPTKRQDSTEISGEQLAAETKADEFLTEVKRLGVPFKHERSFQFTRNGLFTERFLLGINQPSRLEGDWLDEICQRLRLPSQWMPELRQQLPKSNAIHFGFESTGETYKYKLYFEFPARKRLNESAEAERILLHQAYKWDAVHPHRHVISKYHWFPRLSVQRMTQRIARIYEEPAFEESLDVAIGVLKVACKRINPEDIEYLEVSEEDTPRRSFDLNLYTARLHLHELYPALIRICRHYQVDEDKFEAFYHGVKMEVFGHLAGGIHRNGEGFFNVYYGVEDRRFDAQ